MKFKSADKISETVWSMKLASVARGQNRALMLDLYNGAPPYTDQESEENNYSTNVNFLEGTTLVSQACQQWRQGMLNTGVFFNVKLDCGPIHKRDDWGRIITKEINKQLKKGESGRIYREVWKSVISNVVVFGIGPRSWEDSERPIPYALGLEDVLIPSRTLLTMENLELFAIYRRYTPCRLWKLTHGPKVDPGWNIPMVESAIKERQQQILQTSLGNTSFTDLLTPEQISEDMKENPGYYAGDAVPTIDCWDFYYYDEEGDETGWKRKIVPDMPINSDSEKRPSFKSTDFIYNPGERVYASKLSQIIHFQYGDISIKAPFQYHSVRSLGFLLYAVCHLQNRLRCRFNDHVFTQLLELFRVNSPEEFARLVKMDLVNKGIIEPGVSFVPAAERYTVNDKLIGEAFMQNRQSMSEQSASYRQNQDFGKVNPEETATSVMARLNASTQLVSATLAEGYNYAVYEYEEICRRFCIANSKSPEVRKFRLACKQQGVPDKYLDAELWNVEPERVMGGGNRMLEIAQAKDLMAIRPLLDPDPQRIVTRNYVRAVADPDMANTLVPIEGRMFSDAAHDAELALGTLMDGFPMRIKTGINHIDYVETMLDHLTLIIMTAKRRGHLVQREIEGVPNLAKHITEHISIIAQDNEEKERVKEYNDKLGRLMNEFKAMTQQMNQMLQKQMETAGQGQGGNGGVDPKDQARVQGMMMQAQTKAKIAQISHAQRTAQRHAQWQLEQKQRDQDHQLEMAHRMQDAKIDAAVKDVKTAAEIRATGKKGKLKSTEE